MNDQNTFFENFKTEIQLLWFKLVVVGGGSKQCWSTVVQNGDVRWRFNSVVVISGSVRWWSSMVGGDGFISVVVDDGYISVVLSGGRLFRLVVVNGDLDKQWLTKVCVNQVGNMGIVLSFEKI